MKEPVNQWVNKLLDSRPGTNMVKGTEIWVFIILSIKKKPCEACQEERVKGKLGWIQNAGSRMWLYSKGSSFWRGRVLGPDLYFRCAFSPNSIRPSLLASKYEYGCEWLNPYQNFNMWNSSKPFLLMKQTCKKSFEVLTILSDFFIQSKGVLMSLGINQQRQVNFEAQYTRELKCKERE